MANVWEERVIKIVNKLIRTEFAHIQSPTAVYGKITKVAVSGYSIVILDENKNRNEKYPEIPNITSKQTFLKGDIVAVIFLNGQDLYILGSI